jgi:hypothetical protein
VRLFLALAILSGLTFAQGPSAPGAPPASNTEQPSAGVEAAANTLPDLPRLPRGNSTVMGGAIRKVDRVRDRITVAVFGGRDMTVLFDERTQVYRDGVKSSQGDLRNGERVSVETMLDGSAVFARSIHMLSQALHGECQGQVLEFDRSNGELTVRDTLSPQPIKLRVSATTKIGREGQEALSSANLGAGALVKVVFEPDGSGHDVARQIAILATPGNAFVFSGRVTFLDLHSGLLVLVDPRDKQSYEVAFDPSRVSASRNLHEGDDVVVTASFDGARYKASAITGSLTPSH